MKIQFSLATILFVGTLAYTNVCSAQGTSGEIDPATGADGTTAVLVPGDGIVLTKCNPINGCKKN